MTDKTSLNDSDIKVLRELGEWKARASETTENQEKIQAWIAHDAGVPGSRVMVIAETWYLNEEERPVKDSDLLCVDPWARDLEFWLRQKKFEIEQLRDDNLVLPWIEYAPHVWAATDFGVPSGKHRAPGVDRLAFSYQPPFTELNDEELSRLKHREFRRNPEGEEQERERLQAIFSGILPVRRRMKSWQQSLPITSICLDFVGMDGFMMLLCLNPEGLHRLMSFIRDDHLAYLRFLEDNDLLILNNEADYICSGLMGFSKLLPAPDFSGKVRFKDLWYYCESQESVGLGPAQFGEFVFPYVNSLAEKFGRVYYGCCEPVDNFLEYLGSMKNLQRVSVSPWANEEKVGQFCRERGIVYSRKPSPNLFMGEKYDEGAVHAHLEKTVECARGCSLEFIHRDVYVCNNEIKRFVRWVELAREAGSKHKWN